MNNKMMMKEIFEDLWDLKISYFEFQKQLGGFVEKLFPVGSEIVIHTCSFPEHGKSDGCVKSGIVKRICTEGNILYIDDKGRENQVSVFYLIENFYWREIHPMPSGSPKK